MEDREKCKNKSSADEPERKWGWGRLCENFVDIPDSTAIAKKVRQSE